MIYVHGWVQDQLMKYWKRKAEKQKVSYEEIERKSIWGRTRYKKCFLAPITAAGGIVLLMAVLSSEITTTDEYCIDFITSGKLARYTEVRKEQFRILSDETISDAVIPEVWESQYPLCHMALSDTMNSSFNADQARYYGKNSVIAYQAD